MEDDNQGFLGLDQFGNLPEINLKYDEENLKFGSKRGWEHVYPVE